MRSWFATRSNSGLSSARALSIMGCAILIVEDELVTQRLIAASVERARRIPAQAAAAAAPVRKAGEPA
jgi:siroheme synthase